MQFAVPKEKPDASATRQAAVREALQIAETNYARSLKEPGLDMQDWFFHKAEKRALEGI